MIQTKWVLADLGVGDSWTMLRNPRTMTSVAVPHQTQSWPAAAGGQRLAFRVGRRPVPWEFSGVLGTEAEYGTMLAWSLRNVIRITDHLGRVHEVVPVSFEPRPKRNRKEQSWRFEYTFKALYIRRIA